MGCTVREKHVKPSRRIRPVALRSDPPLCLIERIALSKSIVESSLKNLVYHPGLTDSGSVVVNSSSSPSEEEEENMWGYCTEEHLEEILLKHLEFFYNQAVSKLLDLGYEEGVAVKAVLSNGHCYGELDVLTNIVNNSLSYLNSSTSCDGQVEDRSETDFTDLRDLEEYSLAGMIYLLQQVKPNLSKGDAMWCLLMSELHVGRATTMDIPTPGNRARCCCTSSTKDDDSNKEDVVGSTSLDIAGFMAPALCRFHGGWDFGNGGGPEFSGNGFSTSGAAAELKLQREIDCPKRFNLSPSMKSLLKRNVAAFAAGFRASMKQKQIQSGTSGDPARVETCEQPRKSGSEESVSSVLEKFRDLNLDDDNLESVGEDGKDCVIVNLLHQVKDLEKKLKERKEWAHQKAMQAAQKVSEELADLKSLNSEREAIQLLLKKGKKAVEESTLKRLDDKESEVKKATTQMDSANKIVRKLENQNAEIRAEREGSKLSASESLKACMEETKKEKKCLKKLVAWEKQKLKLQDEITAEKDKINALYRTLAQTTQDEKDIEARWRQEQKAKEEALAQMEEEQRSKEAAEGHNKRKLETLRLKIELDFQRHKDDHQRLEQELSRLRASSDTDSSHLSNNVWKAEKSQGENIAKLLEELDKLEGTNENEANYDRECIICMKDEVSVVFLPCAHQVVCGSCSDSFFASNNNGGRKVTCPCCRSLIQQRIRIFGATS
ncbi:PREDICTED: MND1-interacting protein 1-like [Camelina sativa]|uniref:MND1-interacting protein 1-like n=1 Tax=Camelina sativa TaxID=90675 RepID=A0ABM0X055_CAMSA|nr:PREDICTED: MND1-interacting protein 1-like [Camelina sativa]